MSEKGIMSGYTGKNAGKFGPNDSITRGQVVTILYRVFNEPDVSNLFSIFTDVQDTKKYYYNAVIWANAAGIVKGYEDSEKFGTFLPNKPISRQELAVILQRAAKFAFQYRYQEQSLDGFKDKKDISGWATDGIKWAVKKGIISGKERSDGYYIAPKDNAKRSEVAKMITMFLIKVL